MGGQLRRLNQKCLSILYHLSGWVLGIAIFGIVFFGTERYLGIADEINFFLALVGASIAVSLIALPFERRRHRLRNERFISAWRRPQKPVDILSNEPTAFRPDWGTVLWVPDAGISMSVDNSALQIVSFDLQYNVLIPIQLIIQIEFDPGDGPPGERYPGMSWRREWFGWPYAPTVYLGLRFAPSQDIVVYPLCFRPKNDEDARILYQRLMDGQRATSQSISFPLETIISEDMLPGSFESQYLRTTILQRFWPDYRPKTVREWLSR
jgi:hypothetical protein